MFKRAGILLLSIALASCASPNPVEPGRPIKSQGSFISRNFSQGDKLIGPDALFTELKQHEQTKSSASAAEIWMYGSMVPAGVGGYLIGYSLFSNQSSSAKQSGLLVGVGLIGVAFGAAYFADKNLMESVNIYNEKVVGKSSTNISVRPMLTMIQAPSPRYSAYPALVPLAGISVSY